MERWLTGVKFVVPMVALWSMLAGCTEPEPLYCDPEHPCLQLGYICKYSRRTCVLEAQKDSGGADQLSDTADLHAGESVGDLDAGDQGTVQPDQGAAPDALPDQGSSGADAAGGDLQ